MKFACHSAISEFSRLLQVSRRNSGTSTENDGSLFLLCHFHCRTSQWG
jgi:hypothetical protein